MFEIGVWSQKNNNHYIKDGHNNYLHSDGSVYPCAAEYFPTREFAQAVLDKFQPSHKWVHGDVFELNASHDSGIMIYIKLKVNDAPQLFYISKNTKAYQPINYYLRNATFLFNIKEKI